MRFAAGTARTSRPASSSRQLCSWRGCCGPSGCPTWPRRWWRAVPTIGPGQASSPWAGCAPAITRHGTPPRASSRRTCHRFGRRWCGAADQRLDSGAAATIVAAARVEPPPVDLERAGRWGRRHAFDDVHVLRRPGCRHLAAQRRHRARGRRLLAGESVVELGGSRFLVLCCPVAVDAGPVGDRRRHGAWRCGCGGGSSPARAPARRRPRRSPHPAHRNPRPGRAGS